MPSETSTLSNSRSKCRQRPAPLYRRQSRFKREQLSDFCALVRNLWEEARAEEGGGGRGTGRAKQKYLIIRWLRTKDSVGIRGTRTGSISHSCARWCAGGVVVVWRWWCGGVVVWLLRTVWGSVERGQAVPVIRPGAARLVRGPPGPGAARLARGYILTYP